MGFLKGLLKIADGTISSGMGGAYSDGPAQYCLKCGSRYHGICTACARKNGTKLIEEGIKDIKSDDEQIYIEAEKRGYIKASEEYKTVFKDIQAEYKKAKENFERIIKEKDVRSEQLISQYEQLVDMRKKLELDVKKGAKAITDRSGISSNAILNSLSGSFFSPTSNSDLFSILRSYREKKILEAECKGYNRAKKNYEKKIRALKQEFEELKNESNKKIEEMHVLIAEILTAISAEHMKIATLKIID